jgi:hypothetical protein
MARLHDRNSWQGRMAGLQDRKHVHTVIVYVRNARQRCTAGCMEEAHGRGVWQSVCTAECMYGRGAWQWQRCMAECMHASGAYTVQ